MDEFRQCVREEKKSKMPRTMGVADSGSTRVSGNLRSKVILASLKGFSGTVRLVNNKDTENKGRVEISHSQEPQSPKSKLHPNFQTRSPG